MALTDDEIKRIAISHGFTARVQPDCRIDLNEYVYAFAREMFAAGQREMQAKAGEVANKSAARILAANTYRGRTSSTASFAAGMAEGIGLEIRSLKLE